LKIPFPDKQYNIIYAYPPWSYNDKMKGYGAGAETYYEPHPLEWIKALPLKDLAQDSSLKLFP